MGGLARDLKNDDSTDIGYDLLMDQVTSPVTADVGVTRIDVGTSTTYTPMSSSNPLFAQLTAGSASIGTLGANAGTTIGAVEIAAAQTLATVTTVSTVTNLAQLGGTAISMNTGTRDAGTQRVTIATDDTVTVNLGTNNDVTLATLPDTAGGDLAAIKTAVEIIDNAISGSEMQVDVVASLPAGTNAIGKLAANSGVDIGDVDVLSVIPGTGATNLGKAEDAAHSSGDTGVMALAVRSDSLAAIAGTTGDYSPLQVTADGALYVSEPEVAGRYDVFGRAVSVSPNNDIDAQFFRAAPETLVNVTTANSATATQNVGGALFASSTNASGSVQGVSRTKTVYRSGSEIYAMFTASFTAGIANSYMRIGLYDANNGFFIGYEGTSFGATVRNNTSDTTVASGSFSEDALTGAAGSRFTRAGTPEAIDLTKLNVFRIRFGWLGSAPVYWEVMAPDGHWVCFHKTLFPNLQATPSIRDSDLPITLDITKTAAAATDLQIQTDCWGAGATLTEQFGLCDLTNSRSPSIGTLSAGTSWNASGPFVDVHRYSLSKILIYSSTNNAAGTLQVEYSMDGTNVHRTINYDVDDASNHPPHVLIPVAQYMRVSYDADAGGGNNHADFAVSTIHHVSANKVPTSKVTSTLDADSDVDNVRAVIVGENPAAGGSYVNVKVDSGGLMQMDVAADSVGLATEATLTTIDADTGNIAAGFATEGSALGSGVLLQGDDGTDRTNVLVDTDGHLQVDLLSSVALDVSAATVTVDSELPAAAALADNAANPTAPAVGAFGMVWDGSTWDRTPGTSADGVTVNLGSNNDVVATATQLDIDDLAATADNVGAALMTNVMHDGTTALTPKFAVIDAASSGDNTLVAAVAGKKIRVLACFLQSAGTVNVRFESGAAGTALTGQMNNVANTGFVLPFNPVGWFETASNTLLNLELSAAISVDGCLTYVEV